jgi:hypothetical protein
LKARSLKGLAPSFSFFAHPAFFFSFTDRIF